MYLDHQNPSYVIAGKRERKTEVKCFIRATQDLN